MCQIKNTSESAETTKCKFSILCVLCALCGFFLFLPASLYAEERAPEIPLMVECPCPILLDTLQLDLGLIKLPTPAPFDEQAIR